MDAMEMKLRESPFIAVECSDEWNLFSQSNFRSPKVSQGWDQAVICPLTESIAHKRPCHAAKRFNYLRRGILCTTGAFAPTPIKQSMIETSSSERQIVAAISRIVGESIKQMGSIGLTEYEHLCSVHC
jgi:hypothetical protein